MEHVDLLIKNASELATLAGSSQPRTGQMMRELAIIQHGSIAIHKGKIIAVGKNVSYSADQVIDATGKTVMPGFIDPHTHLVFGGSREFELDMKLHGLSYMDILAKGGGIQYTVEQTRNASETSLRKAAVHRLNTMLAYGTTTCEAKTGYGLEPTTELKLLKIQNSLHTQHPIDIVSTFLGAHAIPKEYSVEDYLQQIIKEMLPKTKGLAEFCDVFCEKNVFSIKHSERILTEGKKYGLTPKIHAEEIVNTGGASLAAKLGALTADHLLMISDKGITDMAQAGVIGVLLPGTPFSLMMKKYAPARKLIAGQVPIALATDLNPNCWTENMQFMIQLACFAMKMTPAEAITAATFNAACAINRQHQVGSLEPFKQADIIILNCKNHMMLPYHFGINLVGMVIKKGKIVQKQSIGF
ncbi:MAG: imidazolonepropionase [Candidatus Thermoplasmatota archaeon]|nr:imidazolonepropionase [Candidatus Thermoplasmatota archaeon]